MTSYKTQQVLNKVHRSEMNSGDIDSLIQELEILSIEKYEEEQEIIDKQDKEEEREQAIEDRKYEEENGREFNPVSLDEALTGITKHLCMK